MSLRYTELRCHWVPCRFCLTVACSWNLQHVDLTCFDGFSDTNIVFQELLELLWEPSCFAKIVQMKEAQHRCVFFRVGSRCRPSVRATLTSSSARSVGCGAVLVEQGLNRKQLEPIHFVSGSRCVIVASLAPPNHLFGQRSEAQAWSWWRLPAGYRVEMNKAATVTSASPLRSAELLWLVKFCLLRLLCVWWWSTVQDQ